MAQMYRVRFANGVEQQVHASALRTIPPAAAPVAVASQVPHGKAPLDQRPAAPMAYPTPTVVTPSATASYPAPAATGIYPQVPTAVAVPNPVPAPAPVIVTAPAPVVVVAPAPATTVVLVAGGSRFLVNEVVEARFRNKWYSGVIVQNLGNKKYKVKFLKSGTFSVLMEGAIRKRTGNVATKQSKTLSGEITGGLNSAAKSIDSLFGLGGTKKKKKQTFKVTTTTTTKMVNGKRIVTKTTTKTPIAAPAGQRLNVVVPAGCFPGQVIAITTPTGKRANVTIPAGLFAGQSFQVVLR